MTDIRFKDRHCPCCGQSDRSRVFDLPAEKFCASNWTYSSDYPAILGIARDSRFAIARCLGCGFVYAELEPDAQFLAQVYNEVIRHEDNLAANENPTSHANRMRYIADLLDLAPPRGHHAALDYGCGLGTTLRLLDAAGVRSIGFDNSDIRTHYAAKSSTQVVSDRVELSAKAPYDMIVCDNVLEHLPNPAEVIGFLASVAAAGAVLYASVPDYNRSFVEAQRRADLAGRSLDMSLNPWEHLNYFDLPHLDRMLGSAGFLPIPDLELAGAVNIGLRRETKIVRRAKNACATAVRLARYALTGRTVRGPNRAFYRFKG